MKDLKMNKMKQNMNLQSKANKMAQNISSKKNASKFYGFNKKAGK